MWAAPSSTPVQIPGLERLGVAAVLVVVLLGMLVYERRRADRATDRLIEMAEKVTEVSSGTRAMAEALDRLTVENRRMTDEIGRLR